MKRLLLSLGCLVPILVAGLVPILAFADDPFVPTGDAPFWQAVISLIGGIKGASLLAGSVLVCQAALALSQSVLGTFEGKYQYLAVCFFSLVVAVLGGLVSGQPFSAALLAGPALAAFQVFGHQLYKQFFQPSSSAVTTALLALAIVPLSLIGAGCTSTGSLKPSCTTLDAVSSSVAAGLSQPYILDCAHPEVLQAALDVQAQSWGLCTAATALAAKAPSARTMVTLPNGEQRLQGVIGSFVCPELSAFVASHLVGGSPLLVQAGCKGTGFSNLSSVACSFIPF